MITWSQLQNIDVISCYFNEMLNQQKKNKKTNSTRQSHDGSDFVNIEWFFYGWLGEAISANVHEINTYGKDMLRTHTHTNECSQIFLFFLCHSKNIQFRV